MTIYDDIRAERQRQDKMWGGPDHDDEHPIEDWIEFIDHQVNKANDLIGGHEDGSDDKFRVRMVKVAALAVACCEVLDRAKEKQYTTVLLVLKAVQAGKLSTKEADRLILKLTPKKHKESVGGCCY